MDLEWVRGPLANVFSVFRHDGTFDDEGQQRFIDFLIQTNAISAYFVRSGMGQMYTYSYDEVERMARLAVDHLDGVAPVLVGTSGIWNRNFDARPAPEQFLAQATSLTKFAQDLGAAGTVHVIPEAMEPASGQTHHDLILSYFESISEIADRPVFIYQPPSTTGPYCVTESLAASIAQLPYIAGMKLSTADAGYLTDIAWAVRDEEFVLIAGNETAFFLTLQLGAKAVIGQGCCVNPAILRAVQTRFDSGDMMGARSAQHSVNKLCADPTPAVPFLKRYANEKGFDIPLTDRIDKENPYAQYPEPMTEESYARFKRLRDIELAKYT